MKPSYRNALLFVALFATLRVTAETLPPDCVKTANGLLQGVRNPQTGICAFKGVPFAAAPVGDLRWKPPQQVKNWDGIRNADKFGPRAMQRPIFGDMVFRSDGVSEDCLYLNVWTPAKSSRERLPVLVYFYGGGFQAGDGSESRYDGESMAQHGIVALTVNYRVSVFGFLAHPGLTAESPHHASGDYGLLDQQAALVWVQKNIAAFGGDPKKVTIAGESAGSSSVCAQMASPLSKKLFARAIGESGSVLGARSSVPLADAEQVGTKFADSLDVKSLAELRAMPADKLLEATSKPGMSRFPVTVDGYFFPKSPVKIFAEGGQAHVPLLVGWNSQEGGPDGVLERAEATPENLAGAICRLYGEQADAVLKVYSAGNDQEALQVSTDLASDRFIAFNTWKWFDMQRKTGGKPVYRYYYAHPRPARLTQKNQSIPSARGAVHSAEIEYALGNLSGNKVYAWNEDDQRVSKTMQNYFANFVKTGNPNGPGLPNWPGVKNNSAVEVMRLEVESQAAPETHAERYRVLDQLSSTHN